MISVKFLRQYLSFWRYKISGLRLVSDNQHKGISSKSKKDNNSVNIMEVQIGSILKETDIIRYKDIYGRVK